MNNTNFSKGPDDVITSPEYAGPKNRTGPAFSGPAFSGPHFPARAFGPSFSISAFAAL